jgi:Adenylate and Guanylate cyclase catalytic domain
MQTAVHSSAIVSSLFPSSVRDQLYPVSNGTAPDGSPPNAGYRKDEPVEAIRVEVPSLKSTQRPLFCLRTSQDLPHGALLLSPLMSFSCWRLYMLLLNKLAKQHGMFKVETIGDCYLAVVGLPTTCGCHGTFSTEHQE